MVDLHKQGFQIFIFPFRAQSEGFLIALQLICRNPAELVWGASLINQNSKVLVSGAKAKAQSDFPIKISNYSFLKLALPFFLSPLLSFFVALGAVEYNASPFVLRWGLVKYAVVHFGL